MSTDIDINPVAAARQIADKATAELAELRERVPHLEQRLQEIAASQAEIEEARMNGSQELAEVRRIATVAAQAHREAVEYARYATGLAGEHEALRVALTREDEAKSAQARYEQIAARIEREENERTLRGEALRLEAERGANERAEHLERIEEVQRVSGRALAELGQATYERLAAEHREIHLANLAEAEEALTLAKMERQRFLDQALAELTPWPQHQQALKPDEMYQDATTATCEAYITLIDALIGSDQGTHLSPLQQMPSIRNKYLTSKDFFILTIEDLYPLNVVSYQRDRLKPLSLINRRDVMKRLLAEYRASRK